MDKPKCMAGIIGYLQSQINIARIELQVNLEVYGEPNKDKVEEVINRLSTAINESEEFWKNRE